MHIKNEETKRKIEDIQKNLGNFNYKIVFSYDGTSFFGYQKQKEERSVQEEIEKVLNILLNNKNETKIFSSGRTDKGVHALNQAANFFTIKKIDDLNLFKYKMNKLLPPDIYIKKINKVPLSFSSRFSSLKKEYFYLINIKEYDPLKRNYELYYSRDIDINKLKDISKLFIGKHNFINFTSKKEDEDNFIRTIFDIRISKINNKYIKITFIGDGFMRYEIRKIIGTFLAYNENKLTKEEIINYLNNNFKERKIINYQVEAKGLYLFKVFYK